MHRPRSGYEYVDEFDAERHHDELRQTRHGRAGKAAALCTILLLASWAGASTLYILFRDDALKLIVERQIALTRSYEERATQLQAEIDRLRSLKLIDQERVDRDIAELVRRQTLLEARQSALSNLAKSEAAAQAPEVTGSIPPATRTPAPASSSPKPVPLSDTILIAPPSERWSRLESRPLPPMGRRLRVTEPDTATEVRISNLARELRAMEHTQNSALNRIEELYDGRERRLRQVFADLGLRPSSTARFEAGMAPAATGGPFLPWSRPPEDPFARQVLRIRSAAQDISALERAIEAVPVRRPTRGETDITSPFGMRVDPFVRQLALHTGVDFRGEPGDAVRAAAAGKVTQAERNGGYGLMVEVDHGSGIVTRYAHLSSTSVAAGDNVASGTVVGRVGSTGRSTGPHLHYEVRVNGEPVDPQRFLRAGLRLRAP